MAAPRQLISLVIKNPANKQDFHLQVKLKYTVARLKKKLHKEYPLNPARDRQRLIYAGHVLLDDEAALRDVLPIHGWDEATAAETLNLGPHVMHLVVSRQPGEPPLVYPDAPISEPVAPAATTTGATAGTSGAMHPGSGAAAVSPAPVATPAPMTSEDVARAAAAQATSYAQQYGDIYGAQQRDWARQNGDTSAATEEQIVRMEYAYKAQLYEQAYAAAVAHYQQQAAYAAAMAYHQQLAAMSQAHSSAHVAGAGVFATPTAAGSAPGVAFPDDNDGVQGVDPQAAEHAPNGNGGADAGNVADADNGVVAAPPAGAGYRLLRAISLRLGFLVKLTFLMYVLAPSIDYNHMVMLVCSIVGAAVIQAALSVHARRREAERVAAEMERRRLEAAARAAAEAAADAAAALEAESAALGLDAQPGAVAPSEAAAAAAAEAAAAAAEAVAAAERDQAAAEAAANAGPLPVRVVKELFGFAVPLVMSLFPAYYVPPEEAAAANVPRAPELGIPQAGAGAEAAGGGAGAVAAAAAGAGGGGEAGADHGNGNDGGAGGVAVAAGAGM